jgi:hypothetical protein
MKIMKLSFSVGLGQQAVKTMLSRQVWRCLAYHYRKQHRLLLKVDDRSKRIDCASCGLPLVQGSDQVIDEVCSIMNKSGMEFEIVCETNIVPL